MADAGKQPISNPDSKETTYVKHALNLALREEDINEHEKNHMLIAWIDAENKAKTEENAGNPTMTAMDKCRKLFGQKFGPKGTTLFKILHKRVDDIREIVRKKKKENEERERTAAAAAQHTALSTQQTAATQQQQILQPVPLTAEQMNSYQTLLVYQNGIHQQLQINPNQPVQHLGPPQQALLQQLHAQHGQYVAHQTLIHQQQQQQQAQAQQHAQQQQQQQQQQHTQQLTQSPTSLANSKSIEDASKSATKQKGYVRLSDEEKQRNREKKRLLDSEAYNSTMGTKKPNLGIGPGIASISSSSSSSSSTGTTVQKTLVGENMGGGIVRSIGGIGGIGSIGSVGGIGGIGSIGGIGGIGGNVVRPGIVPSTVPHQVDAESYYNMLEKPSGNILDYGMEAVTDMHMRSQVISPEAVEDQMHLSREHLRQNVSTIPAQMAARSASSLSTAQAIQAILAARGKDNDQARQLAQVFSLPQIQLFVQRAMAKDEGWKFLNIMDKKALEDVTNGLVGCIRVVQPAGTQGGIVQGTQGGIVQGTHGSIGVLGVLGGQGSQGGLGSKPLKRITAEAEKMVSKGVQQYLKNIMETCIEMSEVRVFKGAFGTIATKGVGKGDEASCLVVQPGPDVRKEVFRKELSMREKVTNAENILEREMITDLRAFDEARAVYMEEKNSRNKKRQQAAIANLENNPYGSLADFEKPWWYQDDELEKSGKLGWEQLAHVKFKDEVARKYYLGKYFDLSKHMQVMAALAQAKPVTASGRTTTPNSAAIVTPGSRVPAASGAATLSVSVGPVRGISRISNKDPFIVSMGDIQETLGRYRVEVNQATGTCVGLSGWRARMLGRP